jgi:hypothetical protein
VGITGAAVTFENAETKNHAEVKSDKKDHYITNMKPAVYGYSYGDGGWQVARVNQAVFMQWAGMAIRSISSSSRLGDLWRGDDHQQDRLQVFVYDSR